MPRGIYPFERRKNVFQKGHMVSLKTRLKQSLSHFGKKIPEEQKKKMGKSNEKHWNWQGGKTKNPKYYYNKTKRRRARLLGNGGSHTLGEWETLKAQYNWTCPCCKRSEPTIKLTEDHIVPLSKGGSDNLENIQPLCFSCNTRKHTKIINYLVEELKNK